MRLSSGKLTRRISNIGKYYNHMLVKRGVTSLNRLIFPWIYFRDCKFWYSTRRYIFIDLFHLFLYLTVAKYVSFTFGDRFQISSPTLTELKHIN